jgi:multifunctional methyltransferase subunit TRM112
LEAAEGLPPVESYSEETLADEETIKRLHHVLLEIEIVEGELVCPETGIKFPITNGIPNMLSSDDQ